jgi:hypothetical protein
MRSRVSDRVTDDRVPMSDREALLALYAREPDIWEHGYPTRREDLEAWDGWNRLRIEAMHHAAGLLP